MNVVINLDIEGAMEAIEGWKNVVHNQRKYKLFRTCADLLLRTYWSETFIREGARRGHAKWTPLSEKYAAWKTRGAAKFAQKMKEREEKRKAKDEKAKDEKDKLKGPKKIKLSKVLAIAAPKTSKRLNALKKALKPSRKKTAGQLLKKKKSAMRYPKSSKMLILTGHLQGSARIQSETTNDLFFGTQAPYAQYHQLGGEAFGHPGRPPKRELMFITDKDTEEIEEFLVIQVQRILDQITTQGATRG